MHSFLHVALVVADVVILISIHFTRFHFKKAGARL